MTVLSIKEKKGEYKDKKYHNVMLHCIKSDKDAIGGKVTEVVKIKFADADEIFGKPMSTQNDWETLIDQNIKVSYDRFGTVTDVIVFDKNGEVI